MTFEERRRQRMERMARINADIQSVVEKKQAEGSLSEDDEAKLNKRNLDEMIRNDYLPYLKELSNRSIDPFHPSAFQVRGGRKLETEMETADKKLAGYQIVSTKSGVPTGKWYDLDYCERDALTGNYTVRMTKNAANKAVGISGRVRRNVPPSQIRRKPIQDPESILSPEQVREWRTQQAVSISENCDEFRPYSTFSQLKLPKMLQPAIKTFKMPMPIQSQAWPILMQGRDLIGVAETGSGKTLAFVLPMFLKMQKLPLLGKTLHERGPLSVILAPTRELAAQIFRVSQSIGDSCGFRSAILFGGINKHRQTKVFRNGTHTLVTSPGRLLEVIRERKVSLKRTSFVVMDEADLMLDMGFKADILNITSQLPSSHQIAMFSATWPQRVADIGKEILTNPVTIMVGIRDDLPLACRSILQLVEIIEDNSEQKFARLVDLLQRYHSPFKYNRIIIFVRQQTKAHVLDRKLRLRGFHYCECIHAGKTTRERLKALRRFSNSTKGILIASDVAARGLDIPNVAMVLNFDFPKRIEDYIHRIGRTGRAGAKGLAYTFFTEIDKPLSSKLKRVLYQSGAYVPPNLCTFLSEKVRKEKEKELAPNINRLIRQRRNSGKEALMMPFTAEEVFGNIAALGDKKQVVKKTARKRKR